MEEIKSLQGKISTLKNEHEALESTAALLRDELEARDANISSLEKKLTNADVSNFARVKVFRIIPEFRILRVTFHRKSASKCRIMEIIISSPTYYQSVKRQLSIEM